MESDTSATLCSHKHIGAEIPAKTHTPDLPPSSHWSLRERGQVLISLLLITGPEKYLEQLSPHKAKLHLSLLRFLIIILPVYNVDRSESLQVPTVTERSKMKRDLPREIQSDPISFIIDGRKLGGVRVLSPS